MRRRRSPRGQSFAPRSDRRLLQRGVQIAVIPDHFQRQPSLQLVEGQRGVLGGVVVAKLGHVRKRRAREQMRGAHHRADQPLDMAAVVRPRHRAINQSNTMLIAAALERARLELLGVVEMERLGNPGDRPFGGDAQPRQPRLLRQDQMLDGQRHGSRRRRLERDIEPRHHAARHIDRQGQPRSPDGLAMHGVDHEHVDLGMIDLHDFERMARTVFAHDRREARAGGLRSFPVLQEQALILARDPGLYRIPRRRTRAADPAQLAHMPSQRVDARLLARAIEFLDRVVDELVLVGRKPARSLLRPTSPGDERAGDRRSAKLLDQFIKPRPSDAQLSTGLVDCSRLDPSPSRSADVSRRRAPSPRASALHRPRVCQTLFTSRPPRGPPIKAENSAKKTETTLS